MFRVRRPVTGSPMGAGDVLTTYGELTTVALRRPGQASGAFACWRSLPRLRLDRGGGAPGESMIGGLWERVDMRSLIAKPRVGI